LALFAELNRLVVAKGDGATATMGSAAFDEETGFWHVSAASEDPRNSDAPLRTPMAIG
jgi:hypothetical protein